MIGDLARIRDEASEGHRVNGSLDEIGVELSATALIELGEYHVDPKGLTVRSVCGHRIDSISDSNDPSAQRDLFCYHTIWIAPTVPPFMMVPDTCHDVALEP